MCCMPEYGILANIGFTYLKLSYGALISLQHVPLKNKIIVYKSHSKDINVLLHFLLGLYSRYHHMHPIFFFF